MGIIEKAGNVGESLSRGHTKVARFFYDFAVDGGAVEELTLRGEALPKSAIITSSLVNVETKLEAAEESKVLVSLVGAGDIQAAKKTTEAPWSTATPKLGTQTAASTPIVTTEEGKPKAKIETHALTAGKFSVIIHYLTLA